MYFVPLVLKFFGERPLWFVVVFGVRWAGHPCRQPEYRQGRVVSP